MIFNKTYDHWRLPEELAKVLKICRSCEPSPRYGIDQIHIEANTFVATDGQRLLVIEQKHDIREGCYFITGDNWLLNSVEAKFPFWRDIVPEVKKLKSLFKSHRSPADFSIVVAKLIAVKVAFDLTLFYPVFLAINSDDLTDFEVFVHKKDTSTSFFIVKANCDLGKITYIQMPAKWDCDA